MIFGLSSAAADEGHRVALREPTQEYGDRLVSGVRVPVDGADRTRDDHVAGYVRIEPGGGRQGDLGVAGSHDAGTARADELHGERATEELTAGGEHLERGDDIKGIEAVEEHDLDVDLCHWGSLPVGVSSYVCAAPDRVAMAIKTDSSWIWPIAKCPILQGCTPSSCLRSPM